MALVAIGLGSNVGDAGANIQSAVTAVSEFVRLRAASSLYGSAPMYVLDQAPFMNAVAIGDTELAPRELLRRLKEIETRLGRVERERNGPREIDLDILTYGRLAYRFLEGGEVRLQIPHPKLSERRFVLLPLTQVVPDLFIPGLPPPAQLLPLTESQSQDVTRIQNEVLSIHRPR